MNKQDLNGKERKRGKGEGGGKGGKGETGKEGKRERKYSFFPPQGKWKQPGSN